MWMKEIEFLSSPVSPLIDILTGELVSGPGGGDGESECDDILHGEVRHGWDERVCSVLRFSLLFTQMLSFWRRHDGHDGHGGRRGARYSDHGRSQPSVLFSPTED